MILNPLNGTTSVIYVFICWLYVPIQVSSMTLNLPAPQKVLGSKIEVALKPLVGPKDFQLGTFFHKHRTVRPLAGRRGGQCDPLILTRLFLKATRFFI